NYNRLGAVGTFYYRVAPKTRMLFEIDLTDYNYQNNDASSNNQSSQQYQYLAGVTWEATAKTTGIFKIGYRNKNYDNKNLADLSGLAIWLDGAWKPNTYTKITFGASQDTQESAQSSSSGYVRRYLKTGLSHAITPRTKITAKLKYGNDEFNDNSNRKDDRLNASLSVEHSLLRWLDVSIAYRHEKRDSSLDIYDFSANIFMLTVSTRFDNRTQFTFPTK
ncbi:hypothetical protein QQ73_13570, partial [Candidatus Endoriftia persephone str. Guaymas]|nr:hypothetical protein [Candidatus Endoriftia persephone str. Guaymas]